MPSTKDKPTLGTVGDPLDFSLSQLRHAIEGKYVTREDFVKLAGQLMSFVTESVKAHKLEMAEVRKEVSDALKMLQAKADTMHSDTHDELVSMMETCINKINLEMEASQSVIDAKLAELKDGEDGRDADEDRIVSEVLKNVPPHDTKDIEKKIEDLQDIIEELRDELSKKGRATGGGTAALPVSHWPLHEEFTMNGLDTTVTLSQGVGAAGNAIFGLRYQGQVQVQGTDYSVNGNLITFLTFTPEADTVISVTYLP